MSIMINQSGVTTPYIYTTDAGGLKVFDTPAASTGKQAGQPLTETPSAKGIVVPVRQVLSEYNEVGNFAAINGAPPDAGDQPGEDTVVKQAAQSTSTGNEQNSTTDSEYLHAPWSTKSVV